jgi:hypothetical protein
LPNRHYRVVGQLASVDEVANSLDEDSWSLESTLVEAISSTWGSGVEDLRHAGLDVGAVPEVPQLDALGVLDEPVGLVARRLHRTAEEPDRRRQGLPTEADVDEVWASRPLCS